MRPTDSDKTTQRRTDRAGISLASGRGTLTRSGRAGRHLSVLPTWEPIPVRIEAHDPLSQAGAVAQLGRHNAIELIDNQAKRPGTVLVLITDSLHETALVRLRRLVRTDGVRLVLVVDEVRDEHHVPLIACGIDAVLRRGEATEGKLLRTVLATARGEGDPAADLRGLQATRVGVATYSGAPRPVLTTREVEVLGLFAEGMSTLDVAAGLGCSERTVKNVLKAVTARLGLRNRVQAVSFALRQGYI
ncbi:response regulator transcription factor [Streptomyces sp. NPDC060205]|uniref:helix-turn-helix transcriptional regulator n=1 Tax=Streptomyces sp. NPDC060205 TaxID=3347072 RepID=UPI00365FBE8B